MTKENTPFQVVQLASLGDVFDAQLAERFSVLPLWTYPCEQQALQEHGKQAIVAVTSVRKGFTREHLNMMPQLRAVCSWGVGYETLDVQAAVERKVQISNTPDVLDDCVADLAWALLLTAARRTAVGDRYVKGGQWKNIGAFPLSTRVWGRKLGILGMGRIGAAIAQRGSGFTMQVRYHNRRERPEFPYAYVDSLVELAKWADFLVVACPGGDSTRHLVNAQVLDALGPKGIVVNIARGSVIDEQALVAALEEGRLGGAGLDVLEHEPAVPQAFKAMDQIALMPHVGSATFETRADMAQLVFDNAVSYFESGRLLTPVAETRGFA